MNPWLALGLAVVGSLCLGFGVRALRLRSAEECLGSLVAIDPGAPATLRSYRYRLVGRPDALRRRDDGSLVPVELKHRAAPARGPFASHLVQLGAYCLLVEDTTGQPPPFGVLRYTDREVHVRWDEEQRRRVLAILGRATAPYEGRADPSPEKCRRCVWSPRCDASLADGRQPRGRRERRARYTSVR